MNRKEGIIVGALLLTTFVGSTFAAPAVQQMLILNDPLNVRITGPPSTVHTASVDIEALRLIPGITTYQGTAFGSILTAYTGNPPFRFNFTSGFSFAPERGFIEVTSTVLTITYVPNTSIQGSAFGVQLNGQIENTIPMPPMGASATTITGSVRASELRVGANLLSIGVVLPPNNSISVQLYEVRLTVEYTFMA